VQQHIDTLNTSLLGIRGQLKQIGLLQQQPVAVSSTSNQTQAHQDHHHQQQQQQPEQESQLSEQQQLQHPSNGVQSGSPDAIGAVCLAMEGLSVSVQHLLELLPSARYAAAFDMCVYMPVCVWVYA
jgi:hypothetical protein